MDVCVRLCYTCILHRSARGKINLEMKGYCRISKQCHLNQLMQYFPGQFELPQQKHLCCDLCTTPCLCHCTCRPATAADRVNHAVIAVYLPSSAHACKRLKLALKELHQQLMNQALVNQRKEPQNQNIHDSKLTCNDVSVIYL